MTQIRSVDAVLIHVDGRTDGHTRAKRRFSRLTQTRLDTGTQIRTVTQIQTPPTDRPLYHSGHWDHLVPITTSSHVPFYFTIYFNILKCYHTNALVPSCNILSMLSDVPQNRDRYTNFVRNLSNKFHYKINPKQHNDRKHADGRKCSHILLEYICILLSSSSESNPTILVVWIVRDKDQFHIINYAGDISTNLWYNLSSMTLVTTLDESAVWMRTLIYFAN
jgi:hypothetical protein